MTVSTDFYVATEQEALAAFSWLNVTAVGDEPLSPEDRRDFEAFSKYVDAYENWRLKQSAPHPDEASRAAMARLPLLNSKFILVEKLVDLRAIFVGSTVGKATRGVLFSPAHLFVLEQLTPDFTLALATPRDEGGEARIRAALTSLDDDWRASGDPVVFVAELRTLARRAIDTGRHIFVLTTGDG